MSVKVTYSREEFIKLADVGKKLAIEYCNNNPKERYDYSDFEAVWYTKKPIECTGGPVGSLLWNEEMSNFDRIISIYMRNTHGE